MFISVYCYVFYQAYYTVLWCCQHYCQNNPSETMLPSGRRIRIAVSETGEVGRTRSTATPTCNS
jgi:glucose-6-phosphate-specific signal transduction histidine kinase